ncbi:MAG: RHS repeat domain-containing protein [Ruminiclostridium sp.]
MVDLTLAQYKYNDQGLRSKKVAGTLTEYYYYDTGHLSYITNASNNLKYFFTRDAQGNLLNMIDWTAVPHKTYWYMYDAHQNVLGLVDDSGQFVVNYQYNAFGEITSSTGTAMTGDGRLLRDANPFRYSSYQYDTESGFYYLKSRYYIPFMGKFLTRDKVSSNNLYVYCNNNPVMYVDSSGNCLLNLVFSAAGAALFGGVTYLIGRIFNISGWTLTAAVVALGAVGGILAGILGPKFLVKVAPKLVKWFRNVERNTKIFGPNKSGNIVGVVLFNVIKIMIHRPHVGKHNFYHIQIEVRVGNKWVALPRVPISGRR